MVKRGVDDGYHQETRKVSTLVSRVAKVHDGWNRSEHLKATQMNRVSKLYGRISKVISDYGELASKDVKAFHDLGLKIKIEDQLDANTTRKNGDHK
ncbi:MAG: hypothetical protein LBM27_04500 [Lactobacillaceae bacterium]|jgi:hypothetical protein|nr:hypothetical protein [Lactobacillaceae bacterium]